MRELGLVADELESDAPASTSTNTSSVSEPEATRLLPELLDRLIELGDLARQISVALGGNGHRADQLEAVMREIGGNR